MLKTARPLLALLLLELAAFTWSGPRLGFLHDDWVLLDVFSSHHGLLSRVQALAQSGLGARPLALPVYALAYSLGKMSPLPYHLVLGLLGLAGAWLYYRLLKESLGSENLALTAAALALLHPAASAVHLWFSAMPQVLSQDLVLAGLLLYARWLESRRALELAGALGLYLASLLCYESSAYLPIIVALGCLARKRQKGHPWRTAVPALLKDFLPLGLTLAAGVLWQVVGVRWVFSYPSPKTLGFSRAALLATYSAGLDCLTGAQLWSLCRAALPVMLREFTTPHLLATAVAAAAAVALIERGPKPGPEARLSAWAVMAIGLVCLAGAYAPYALAGYTPRLFGVLSRINGGGVLAAGLLMALALECWARPKALHVGLLAALVTAFGVADHVLAAQWGKAWWAQKAALDKVALKSRAVPAGANLLVQWQQPYVFGADMFYLDEPWGFNAAARVATGRPDLTTTLVTPWMASERAEIVERKNGTVSRSFPYGNTFIYQLDADQLLRATPPAAPTR